MSKVTKQPSLVVPSNVDTGLRSLLNGIVQRLNALQGTGLERAVTAAELEALGLVAASSRGDLVRSDPVAQGVEIDVASKEEYERLDQVQGDHELLLYDWREKTLRRLDWRLVKFTAGADGEDGAPGPPGPPGPSGADAPALLLYTTAQTMAFDGEGAASPAAQTITFRVELLNLTGGTLTWTATRYDGDGEVIDTVTLGTSGSDRTLTDAQFGAAAYVVVSAAYTGGYYDQITVYRLASGTNAVAGYLTNEAHVVGAAADGTGYSFTGSGGSFKVWHGAVDVTEFATFSIVGSATKNGLTIAVSNTAGTRGQYTLSGASWTTDFEAFTLRATWSGRTIDRAYSISKSRAGAAGADGSDGADGADASAMGLYPTGQVFTFDGNGVAAPSGQVITIFMVLNALSGGTPSITGTLYNAAGVSLGPVDLDGTPLAATLAVADFGAAAYCVITGTYTGGYTDTITIARVTDGAAAYTAFLTNENHTVPAGPDGLVDSWTGASGSFVVYRGDDDVSASFTLATFANPQAVTIGYAARVYTATGAGLAAGQFGNADVNAATVTIRATGSGAHAGVVLDKVLTLAKSRAGADGAPGAPGATGLSIAEIAIYRRSATGPATPTGGAYTFDTQTLSVVPVGGWASAIPAGHEPVYTSRAVAAIIGISGVDSSLTWSDPILVAVNGESVDIVFRRFATRPPTPADSAGVPTDWFSDVSAVPAGSNPMWSSVGMRANANRNWTWQLPVQVEGTTGPTGPTGPPGPTGPTGPSWTPGSVLAVTLNAGALSAGSKPNGRQVWGSRTATPTGGTAPYTYAWTILSQDYDPSVGNVYLTGTLLGPTVGVSAIGTNTYMEAAIICTVTDADGRTATVGFNASGTHGVQP